MAQVLDSPAPPWSDLPPELLGMVFLCLLTRADRAFFPAVCRTWCSAVRQCHLPPPSPVPWLLVPDGSATSFPHGETFQVPDGLRYHNSCGEWLLVSRNNGSCFLMNHFTKVTMPLPSLSSCCYYEQPVEVPKDYMNPAYYSSHTWLDWLDNVDTDEISVVSLVVCSTRLIAAILAVGSADLGTIALCRPGATAWSVSANEKCRYFSHMVFFQEKLYALDENMGCKDLIAIDIMDENDSDEPRVSRIERLIEGDNLLTLIQDHMPTLIESDYMHYLVESCGTLLMIRRKFSFKILDDILVASGNEFDVFEANLEQHLWTVVRTLANDQALFLGRGCSRAVCMSPYDLSWDCIFYLEDSIDWFWYVKNKARSCELYDMKDEKIYSTLSMVSCKSEKFPSIWIFSQG